MNIYTDWELPEWLTRRIYPLSLRNLGKEAHVRENGRGIRFLTPVHEAVGPMHRNKKNI